MSEKNIALSLAKSDLGLVCSGLELQIASFKRAANNARTAELRDTYSRYHDETVRVLSQVRQLELSL